MNEGSINQVWNLAENTSVQAVVRAESTLADDLPAVLCASPARSIIRNPVAFMAPGIQQCRLSGVHSAGSARLLRIAPGVGDTRAHPCRIRVDAHPERQLPMTRPVTLAPVIWPISMIRYAIVLWSTPVSRASV